MINQITRTIKDTPRGLRNLILRGTGKPLKPVWLMFEVTDRCNSRCQQCDIWRKKPVKDPLEPKEVREMLNDPLFRGLEYIINSGGEPVLRQDMEEIILAEHRSLPAARLQLSTNGLLPERVIDVVKTAIQHGISLDVGVSIDGLGEKHDKVRGVKGNFNKADRLLNELVALKEKHGDKVCPTVGFTLSDLTLDSLAEVRAYAQQFNVSFLPQWYNDAPFYDKVGQSFSIKREEQIKAVQSLTPNLINEMWLNWLKGGSIRFSCFAMYTFCALHCNGNIVPCLRFWDVKAGNVRESSPTSIWHSPEADEARKIVKNCDGCLNQWGASWSFSSSFLPYLFFHLRHPRTLVEILRAK